jgi:hypothetical protein
MMLGIGLAVYLILGLPPPYFGTPLPFLREKMWTENQDYLT